MSRRRNVLSGWALACVAIVLFAGLGAWQLGRKAEKQRMLDATGQVLAARLAKPLSAAADPRRVRDYDWAAGSGRFLDAPAVLLDNQQRAGRVGVRAYRVFQPANASMPLLVDLGWLPVPGDRTLPGVARPDGTLQLQGLLAPPPSHGIARAQAVPQPGGTLLTTGLDTAGLRAALDLDGLAPRVLRLDPRLSLGYARDLDILPNTLPPERHLGYAVQWFALALAVLVTALILTFRKARP